MLGTTWKNGASACTSRCQRCCLLAEDTSEYAEVLRRMFPFVGVIAQAERGAV